MSALTFEILSKALTQALAEQSDTPPDTMARCTLGRDKVMILVEYPLDSAQAEPLAVSTLDWLEQHLRHQFDTSGLPEEAADLAASGEEVAVQLFLKHFSEAKPFTMRSFIWKVDDGFDDIFGDVSLSREAHEPGSVSVDTSAGPIFHNPSQAQAPVETTLSETTAITSPSDVPLNDVPLIDDIDEPVPSELDDEHLQLDLEPDLALDFDSQGFESAGMALEGVETQGFAAQDVEAGDFKPDDLGLSVQSASVPDEASLEVTSTPAPSDFELAPTTEPLLEDSLVDTEAAFAAELAASVEEESYSKSLTTDFSLPGESLAVTSSDLDLPTVDLPVSAAPEADASNDFFTFGEPPAASETLSAADSDEMDLFDLKSTEPPSAEVEGDFSALTDTTDGSLFVSEETASEEMPSESSEHTTAEDSSDEVMGSEWSDSESADFESADSESADFESADSESADFESADSESADSEFADSEFADFEFADPLEAAVLAEDVADEPTEDATVAETLFELDGQRIPKLAQDLDREDLSAMDDELGLDFGLVAEQASSAHPSGLASDSAMADGTLVNETLVNEQQIDTDEILAEAPSEPDEFFAESSRSEHEPFLEDDSLLDGLLSLPTVPAKRPAVQLDAEDSRDVGTSDVDEDALGLNDSLENADTDSEALVADGPLPDYEADSQDGSQDDLAGEDPLAKDNSEADDLEEAYEEEDYEDDPVYYLEGEAEEAEPFEEVALVDDGEVQRQREQWQKQSKGNRWVFVGALGLLVLGLLGFVFTRPCTLDKCDRLQTAQAQGDEAIGNLRLDTSLEAVKASKAQLQASIRSLKPIPPWSSYHDEAAAILPEYEAQVSALDQVTKAQSTAYDAAVKSQNPPHSVATWNEIAEDWLTATQLLEAVPTESPVRELANKKLLEYRSNRATILVRIDAESRAEVSLRQSQQAATKATNLAKRAGSLQDWEESLAAWESAVDNLSQIPQGTKAHAEAQQILPGYLEQLEEVRDRTQQERRASRDLFQAKQFAADAQRAEGEEQWMLSSQAFKSAISKLKPIPTDTLAHAEAQVLLDFYTDAMNSAENNLRVALRFQPVEPEFFAACGSTTVQKCTYSMRGGKVRLDLFQGYDTVIDQSITPPDQRAGSALDAQYVSQSTQLLQVITLLSTQAQVPVELYDAQGAFLARYRPDLNGFVREQES